jgi:hypothetical protein
MTEKGERKRDDPPLPPGFVPLDREAEAETVKAKEPENTKTVEVTKKTKGGEQVL